MTAIPRRATGPAGLRLDVINLHLQGMSRTRTQYKHGHIIQVDSIPSLNGYTVHFALERYGEVRDVTHFESGALFLTESEALECGLRMGQQTINNGYNLGVPVTNKLL